MRDTRATRHRLCRCGRWSKLVLGDVFLVCLLLSLICGDSLFAIAACSDEPNAGSTGGYWPQWRGPHRDNVSAETGLLGEWPAEGPPRLWVAEGLGQGIASVAVAKGKIFTVGYQHDNEYALALDEKSGELSWAASLGPAVPENALMRWLSQRVPTVDDDRLYAFTSGGDLICLGTADGKELWRKNYTADFGAKRPVFGFYEQPLIDGDSLVCTPRGTQAQLVFLDKRTGDVKRLAGGTAAESSRKDYVATVVAEIDGLRQYVTFLDQQLTGIAADDGRVLWRYEHVYASPANSQTPIVRGDEVFCSANYGKPSALLKLTRQGNSITVQEQYQRPNGVSHFQDSTVVVGDHLYSAHAAAGIKCLDWRTGEPLWVERDIGLGSVGFTYAEGRLYVRGSEGRLLLVEASPEKFVARGGFTIPEAQKSIGATAPVVAGGRLYLRDNDRLHCYDIRRHPRSQASDRFRKVELAVAAPADVTGTAGGREVPKGVFVPTPHDVVERMLDAGQILKSDVVCDLGCGDGRIVIGAAKRFGCRAVGYEIDHELVIVANRQAEKEGVGKLVKIERADVQTIDLAQFDVVMLYLLPEQIEALVPKLQKLKSGSRIVSHQFPLSGMKLESVDTVKSEESGEYHKIYIYKVPFETGK